MGIKTPNGIQLSFKTADKFFTMDKIIESNFDIILDNSDMSIPFPSAPRRQRRINLKNAEYKLKSKILPQHNPSHTENCS